MLWNSPHVYALLEYFGDGECDDQNNFSWCEYDHGDCCLLSENAHSFCQECLCKSNETNYPISFATKPGYHDCMSGLVGDGFCDDMNNYSWCQYDNGDCCHLETAYENANDFCQECLCKSNESNYPSSFATRDTSQFKLIG